MAACEKLRFAGFELDQQTHELLRNGRAVKLAPQALRLLEFLANRPGRLLTREEIRQEIWSEKTFVDFEQGINKSIRQIRDALNDDVERPRFVETLPRRGYRFIASVGYPENHSTTVPAIDSTHVAFMIAPITEDRGESSKQEAASPSGVVPEPARSARWWLMIAGAVIILVAIGGLARTGLEWNHGVKPIQSLAVLPLENLSHDAEQEYFADGMTDDLITDLAKISALRVISRTSVMQYKGTKKTVAQIARELNVDAVLEGTVTRDQGRVRITAQLIRGTPETHLWADKYEGSLSEVLDLQDAVAKAVANEIQIKLTPQERVRLATPRMVNPEAYEAYLRGRQLHPSEENLPKSLQYFQQAIDKDPGYALAWAWLAETYNLMADIGVVSRADIQAHARAAAIRGLQLDNNLALAVVALAKVTQEYDCDWAGAEREYQRAIDLDPSNTSAHLRYASELWELGRTRESIFEARRGRDLAPMVYEPNLYLAWSYYIARQYDQAELQCRKLIEWEPGQPWGYICQASVHLQTGRQREAVPELQKATALSNRSVYELMYLGHALGITGNRAGGEEVLQEMLELTRRRYVPPENIAIVYEGLGERDRAIQWFEKAYAERSFHDWVLADPRLDNIRTDPRFKDILRRMGLPQ